MVECGWQVVGWLSSNPAAYTFHLGSQQRVSFPVDDIHAIKSCIYHPDADDPAEICCRYQLSISAVSLSHSHALTITCTCCYDEIKSKELKTKICSHADSLILYLCFSFYLWALFLSISAFFSISGFSLSMLLLYFCFLSIYAAEAGLLSDTIWTPSVLLAVRFLLRVCSMLLLHFSLLRVSSLMRSAPCSVAPS